MRPEDIARTWATGPVKAVRLLVGGSINPAFRVQSTAGPFHLRAYRSPDRARAEREHAAIARAVAVRVTTPPPLETRAGGTLA